jgi:hypothetical protein
LIQAGFNLGDNEIVENVEELQMNPLLKRMISSSDIQKKNKNKSKKKR